MSLLQDLRIWQDLNAFKQQVNTDIRDVEVKVTTGFASTNKNLTAMTKGLGLSLERTRSEFYADIRPLRWQVGILGAGAALVRILFTLLIYLML